MVAEDVIDAALRWLGRQPAGEPGFVFLHFYDVHYAYDPPKPYDTMFDRAPESGDLNYKNYFYFKRHLPSDAQFAHQIAQYDESIRYVDAQLARLDEKLRAAGRSVRWVVTSDHGEEFGERGSWGHAHTLYAEQLHVPLIMSGGALPAGRAVDGWVGTHDIAPTRANGTASSRLLWTTEPVSEKSSELPLSAYRAATAIEVVVDMVASSDPPRSMKSGVGRMSFNPRYRYCV